MSSIIPLTISQEVRPPYALRFTDKFTVEKKDLTTFHLYKHALIIPGSVPKTCIIAQNGTVICGGRTVYDTLDSLLYKRDVQCLKGAYFCAISWASSEYYHVTNNVVKSILVALKQGFDLQKYKVLIFKNSPNYVYEYLQLLRECGYKIDWEEVPTDKITELEEMIFSPPNNYFSGEIAPLFSEFRDRVLQHYPIHSPLPDNIYISRNDAQHGRAVVNEVEVMQELTSFGFKSFCLTELSVTQKIQLFSAAKTIIMTHGAGGVHVVYLSPGCRVIDIMNDDDCTDFFSPIVNSLHSFYFGIVCKRQAGAATKIDVPLLKQVLLEGENTSYDIPMHEFRYVQHLDSCTLTPAETICRATDLLRESSVNADLHFLLENHTINRIIPLFSEKSQQFDDQKDAEMQFYIYRRFAELFLQQGDYDHSIYFYKKCLALPLVFTLAVAQVFEMLFHAERLRYRKIIKDHLDQYASSHPTAAAYQALVDKYLTPVNEGDVNFLL